MNSKTLWVEAVRAAAGVPASLKEHADKVTTLEDHSFDETYIQFLDTQVRLSPRGPEWTDRLKRRRAALLPYCDKPLLRGTVRVGNTGFTAEVDPKARAVVHWEQYE